MTIVSEDDPKLMFVPLAEAVIPPGGLIEHIKDKYWAKHPVKGLVFWSRFSGDMPSAQCNANKDIAEQIIDNLYPWADIVFLSSVFRKIKPGDYV